MGTKKTLTTDGGGHVLPLAPGEAFQTDFDLTISAVDLCNLVYSRLASLLDDELGEQHPDPDCIREAQFCIAVMAALAGKASMLCVAIEHEPEGEA